jgi:hydrophobic/amphiphilic exporter-1 (mainly G- bacteria), HAE1 family
LSLIETAVRRPIGTLMVYLAVFVVGLVGLSELAVDLLPEVDAPRITVTCEYEGVAPQDVETLLTRPIERAISTVDGVERIESTSMEGLSRVRLRFAWGMDLEHAIADVRSEIDRIRPLLPEGIDQPLVHKFDLSSVSVAHLGVSGSGDARRLRFLAEEDLARRLEAVTGVARVDVRGGRVREIRVELSRERLAALSIDVQQVSAALARENRNVSAGDMLDGGQEVVIRSEGEYRHPSEIGETVVAHRNGRAVQISELGEVRDGIREIRDELWIDGTPGIRVIVSKQSGANTMEVVSALRKAIDQINADYEGRLHVDVLRDGGKFIEDAVMGVRTAVLLGGALALVVLMAFLRDLRATVVVATAIPLSIMATLALMFFADITLNLVSFGGLALGLGMLVDNSIVVLESVYRKREDGVPPIEAAICGAREVAGAVTAGTLTTVAVFVPVVFLGGFAGVFFREMAVVVCFALACSLAVALTLVPAVAARLLLHGAGSLRPATTTGTWDGSASGGTFERIYARALDGALVRPWTTVLLSLAAFAASTLFVPHIGTELMPETDEGRVGVSVELPVGTPLTTTAITVRAIEREVKSVLRPEEIEHVLAVAGPEFWWRPAGGNKGKVDLVLVSASERKRTQPEIVAALQQALAGIPGADIRVRPETDNTLLRIMRGGGDDRLSIDVLGHDLEVGESLSSSLRTEVSGIAGVIHTQVDRELGQLERTLVVDRTRLGELGLGAADVASAVEHYVLGRVATRYREQGDEYDIRVVLRRGDREHLDQLHELPIALPSGGTVPLGAVARVESRVGPSSLAREDQRRILKISVGIADRDMGSVAADIQTMLDGIAVPEGFDVRLGGEFREQQDTFSRLLLGGVLAIFLVYTVMAVQFESLRGPMVVMTSVPFALIGVVVGLLATNTSLNMNSGLGVIVLVGIMVNNAIVMVDYIGLLRTQRGLALDDAIRHGATRRLRPVLMTTMTTILAMLPLALGMGEGGELQVPLARAVVGGLAFGTAVTLLVVPCVYSLMEGRRARRPT